MVASVGGYGTHSAAEHDERNGYGRRGIPSEPIEEREDVVDDDDRAARARPVWGDGSGEGSASVQHETPRPISQAIAGSPALTKLYREVDSNADILGRFVQDYLDLLADRVDSIRRNLDTHHDEEARIALLSLETTSTMVGAYDLAGIAAETRLCLDRLQRGKLISLMRHLEAEAETVRSRLGIDLQAG